MLLLERLYFPDRRLLAPALSPVRYQIKFRILQLVWKSGVVLQLLTSQVYFHPSAPSGGSDLPSKLLLLSPTWGRAASVQQLLDEPVKNVSVVVLNASWSSVHCVANFCISSIKMVFIIWTSKHELASNQTNKRKSFKTTQLTEFQHFKF